MLNSAFYRSIYTLAGDACAEEVMHDIMRIHGDEDDDAIRLVDSKLAVERSGKRWDVKNIHMGTKL